MARGRFSLLAALRRKNKTILDMVLGSVSRKFLNLIFSFGHGVWHKQNDTYMSPLLASCLMGARYFYKMILRSIIVNAFNVDFPWIKAKR